MNKINELLFNGEHNLLIDGNYLRAKQPSFTLKCRAKMFI